MIANIGHVRKVLGDLHAKKKFGQNFLIDANVVDRIAFSACDSDLKTIEIGPGLGALTEMLLKYSAGVDAYEIDPDMCQLLQQELQDERLQIFHQDFLDTDLSIYREEVNICANLPYYVTTPILFKLFESQLDIRKITVMVQKEVGDRIRAEAGSEDYGALSIETQYLYRVETVLNVSRHVFYPQPNVDSIVLSFIPIRERDRDFEKTFFDFVRSCFRMRRKTLYNNLKDLYPMETIKKIYEELDLGSTVRPQELSVEQYLKISHILNES